ADRPLREDVRGVAAEARGRGGGHHRRGDRAPRGRPDVQAVPRREREVVRGEPQPHLPDPRAAVRPLLRETAQAAHAPRDGDRSRSGVAHTFFARSPPALVRRHPNLASYMGCCLQISLEESGGETDEWCLDFRDPARWSIEPRKDALPDATLRMTSRRFE